MRFGTEQDPVLATFHGFLPEQEHRMDWISCYEDTVARCRRLASDTGLEGKDGIEDEVEQDKHVSDASENVQEGNARTS